MLRSAGRKLLPLLLGWLLLWALLVLVSWMVLPRVHWKAESVSEWLSARAGMPVQVQAADAQWTRRGPVLRLHGLRIGGNDGIQVGRAQWLFSLYDGLLPGRSLSEVHIAGLSLDVLQDLEGKWRIQGVDAASGGDDPLTGLSRLGEIQLSDTRIHVSAQAMGVDHVVPQVDVRLRVDGDTMRAGLRGWLPDNVAPFSANLAFDRGKGNGQLWLASSALPLSPWTSLMALDGIHLRDGEADVALWMDLLEWRPSRIRGTLAIKQAQLAGQRGDMHRIAHLDAVAGWRRTADGWLLSVPRLRIDGESMDGLQIQQGPHRAITAPQVAIGPLLSVFALSNHASLPLQRWINAAAPRLVLHDLQWHSMPGQRWQGKAQVRDVAFKPVGNAPGLSGLSGQVLVDEAGLQLSLDSARAVTLDWPGGFGEPHALTLQGDITAWPENGDWRVGTDRLRVQGTNYGAWMRGGLVFQAAGTRPRLEIAAELDDAPVTAAKRFWIRSKMSPSAIDWLDAALVSGRLQGGVGLVSGDLDHWPFTDRNGRFEARGRVQGGQIHFASGWKDLTDVDAALSFVGKGFELAGNGKLAGVPVTAFTAGIADFGNPYLLVDATGKGASERLLHLLRESPLQASHGDTLNALSVAGPAGVRFSLEQRLGKQPQTRVTGQVDLLGVALGDRRWDVNLDRVRGRVRYDSDGFSAPLLQATMEGNPAQLSLRAGAAHVTDRKQVFQAQLSVPQTVTGLLGRAPAVQWLAPYLDGQSVWQVRVDVPVDAGQNGKPWAWMALDSDLRGTALRLPAPLDKPADSILPLQVQLPLPVDAGEVSISLGQRMAMRLDAGRSPLSVLATLGSDQAEGPLPASGLKVNGQAGHLDALGWIGLAGSQSGDGDGAGLPLEGIDLRVGQLELAGGHFPQTHIRLTPGNARIGVQLDGPSLAGQLTVPDTAGATVVGKLSRLYWTPTRRDTTSLTSPADGDKPLSPSSIPALALDVADVRVGSMSLGSALLRSRALADGLQVDVLQLRMPQQTVDIQGSWRASGSSQRTQLEARVDSQNLGALGGRLGAAGHLQGGEGSVNLTASWNGGPHDFNVKALDGALRLQARNGQLVAVDPGAGRMLGLLSLGQLPRRMLLDFRDLFNKGLAYNALDARVDFANGKAISRGIGIDAPAAQIVIRGHTDLVAQQFAQEVDVNPRSGNLLTVVGAVAGGPVGAAVGAAANAVLSRPLSEIGARTYKVSGPWKEPQVEVIDRVSSPSDPQQHTDAVKAPADAPAPRG